MRMKRLSSMMVLSGLGVILGAKPAPATGQSQQPEASAAAAASAGSWTPRLTPDGQPDIQGIWRANPGGDTYDITGGKPRPDFLLQGNGTRRPATRRIVEPENGQIPYQPWAAAKQKDTADHVDDPTKPEYIDTQAHCLLEGPGRVFIHSGFQILQAPGYVIFFTEENDESRIIPLDNRPHVGQDIKLWQGDSRGHWEGNTLVIDVTNLKAKSRLDMVGNFYSPTAHFVERLTFADDKTINYQATVTDPAVYTQPWKFTARFLRRFPNGSKYEVYEDACHEGERSADRMVIPANVAQENAARAAKAAAATH
jgi:hypothetical protein